MWNRWAALLQGLSQTQHSNPDHVYILLYMMGWSLPQCCENQNASTFSYAPFGIMDKCH